MGILTARMVASPVAVGKMDWNLDGLGRRLLGDYARQSAGVGEKREGWEVLLAIAGLEAVDFGLGSETFFGGLTSSKSCSRH